MLSASITANVPVNGETLRTCKEHTAVHWKWGHNMWTYWRALCGLSYSQYLLYCL